MHRIFVLTGKSASGKDTIYKKLLEDNSLSLIPVILNTTRPIRSKEENGREYFFRTVDEFNALKAEGKIIEYRAYDTVHGIWYYFTADDGQIDLQKGSSLMIGTLESCISLNEYFGKDAVVPIYIDVDDGVRLSRALGRERKQAEPHYEEMCRRFLADQADFSRENMEKAGVRVSIENTDLKTCLDGVRDFILQMEDADKGAD